MGVCSAMTTEDLFWLAVNAYHEARGETKDGIIAVCWVVLNRAKQRNLSVKEVVLQPWQFSWANKNARPSIKEYGNLCKCLQYADEAAQLHEDGKAFLADHYYADYIAKPTWANKMQHVVTIGRHLFYKG